MNESLRRKLNRRPAKWACVQLLGHTAIAGLVDLWTVPGLIAIRSILPGRKTEDVMVGLGAVYRIDYLADEAAAHASIGISFSKPAPLIEGSFLDAVKSSVPNAREEIESEDAERRAQFQEDLAHCLGVYVPLDDISTGLTGAPFTILDGTQIYGNTLDNSCRFYLLDDGPYRPFNRLSELAAILYPKGVDPAPAPEKNEEEAYYYDGFAAAKPSVSAAEMFEDPEPATVPSTPCCLQHPFCDCPTSPTEMPF